MKFKVGDRVAVYGNGTAFDLRSKCSVGGDFRMSGTVACIFTDGRINVTLDSCGDTHTFHSKQCRRLVKKERRRVWLLASELGVVTVCGKVWVERRADKLKCQAGDELIEFIEVKKK